MSDHAETFDRFHIAQRIEHFVLILSFTILALTGLPQKYPLSPISQGIVNGLGGIESIRIIHRVAATVFLLEAIYHLVYVGYSLWVKKRRATMIPTVKDGKDAVQALSYNLGMSKQEPKMPRFNFTEKMEYWAMLWGFLVMAVTGFMLWNPIATARILPGEFIPAAKVAHGGEAILAVLAIIIWHFYHVHIRNFNKSMFTGKISREQMEEEHALELEHIESGQIPPPPPPDVQRRRLMIFVPIAAVVSLALLVGVYYFVTFEETAITTILPPAQEVDVFVPWTPTAPAPTPTLAPTVEGTVVEQPAELTWDATVADVFAARCGACHGALGGFSAETYNAVMAQVEPGNPDASGVITVQADSHPGIFEPDEMELVRSWIEAGAPE